ncbi:DUF7427 family protein [Nocardia salmonicida]|uniref:DUF7427 family protein n=1 Tax=Nocardia salmonicida TaxID=53431 RepID=UPI003F53EAD7
MLTGKQGWAVLFALTLAHEITAQPGELLSEEVDRQLDTHRWATIVVGALTVAHLYNLLPTTVDPFHQATRLVSSIRKRLNV